MIFLHTSDWHLGKQLEGKSRIQEQEFFLNHFIQLAEDTKTDVVLIAGDVYDNGNPPAEAERLFYRTLKELTKNKDRLVVIVAGNHDSPERLTAITPMALEMGVIIAGTPQTAFEKKTYEHYRIIAGGPGYATVSFKGEDISFLFMPYPSEKRLGEIISSSLLEEETQQSYSKRIGEVMAERNHFEKGHINIVMGHFFVAGGSMAGGEKMIQLGGSLTVDSGVFPAEAQYVAMGHLHKAQKVPLIPMAGYYCGSPLQLDIREAGKKKYVYKVQLAPEKQAEVTKIQLPLLKEVRVEEFECYEAALDYCVNNQAQEDWLKLIIHTKRVLLPIEIQQLRKNYRHIVEIEPVFGEAKKENAFLYEEKTDQEYFEDFYQARRSVKPSEELTELFLRLLGGSEV